MTETETLCGLARLKGGAWRNGRRWKVWATVGEWLAADLGLGGFWLYCGPLTVSANRRAVRRNEYHGDERHYAYLSIEWRRRG